MKDEKKEDRGKDIPVCRSEFYLSAEKNTCPHVL